MPRNAWPAAGPCPSQGAPLVARWQRLSPLGLARESERVVAGWVQSRLAQTPLGLVWGRGPRREREENTTLHGPSRSTSNGRRQGPLQRLVWVDWGFVLVRSHYGRVQLDSNV